MDYLDYLENNADNPLKSLRSFAPHLRSKCLKSLAKAQFKQQNHSDNYENFYEGGSLVLWKQEKECGRTGHGAYGHAVRFFIFDR